MHRFDVRPFYHNGLSALPDGPFFDHQDAHISAAAILRGDKSIVRVDILQDGAVLETYKRADPASIANGVLFFRSNYYPLPLAPDDCHNPRAG